MTTTTALADLTCRDLGAAIDALRSVGFRVERISPADNPIEADLSGHGARFRVRRVSEGELVPATLHLGVQTTTEPDDTSAAASTSVSWPTNWTVVPFDAERPLVLPPMVPELVVSRRSDTELGVGRAGMLYRDLIPSRHGGRFIASHIHIPDGGPVPDYVHYHRIRFQLIFCARGWARLVYEDQGEPFIMRAGDAVLQPPEIRHRVLEASDHLEVVEIGCPAEHDTLGELGFDLPTTDIDPTRDFGGQRFVWHQAEGASYEPWDHPGFEARNTGIDTATDGLADVRVARATGDDVPHHALRAHDREFRFHFVLEGSTVLELDGRNELRLEQGDSVSVPAGLAYRFRPSDGLELLDVSVGQPST
ncbi:MAG: cupin domain-containing protein [Acidimicrobiales bacterium]